MQGEFKTIILKPGKEKSLKNRHPWLFSGAISKTSGNISNGDVVEIFSSSGEYLATGHFHNGSISVRIFSFEKVVPELNYWEGKIRKAYDLRKTLNLIDNSETNAYRLINAEGDGMPGLIVDVFGNTAVIQTHTTGMYRIRDLICECLKNIYGNKISAVYDKSAETIGKSEGTESINGYLFGSFAGNEISENGNRFVVDWVEGQKTGFFIDQRTNRKLLGSFSKDRKVLNTFSYTGGFSVYALRGGAKLVHSVDSSEKARELAERNISLNMENAPHKFYTENAFDFIKKSEPGAYDVIILDPPAFAKHLSALKQATIGYKNLNYLALKNIASCGIIFTFSCSQVIDKKLFRQVVFSAAAEAGRNIRILHQLTQPPDHPISIFHPEGEYLKGLVLHVE